MAAVPPPDVAAQSASWSLQLVPGSQWRLRRPFEFLVANNHLEPRPGEPDTIHIHRLNNGALTTSRSFWDAAGAHPGKAPLASYTVGQPEDEEDQEEEPLLDILLRKLFWPWQQLGVWSWLVLAASVWCFWLGLAPPNSTSTSNSTSIFSSSFSESKTSKTSSKAAKAAVISTVPIVADLESIADTWSSIVAAPALWLDRFNPAGFQESINGGANASGLYWADRILSQGCRETGRCESFHVLDQIGMTLSRIKSDINNWIPVRSEYPCEAIEGVYLEDLKVCDNGYDTPTLPNPRAQLAKDGLGQIQQTISRLFDDDGRDTFGTARQCQENWARVARKRAAVVQHIFQRTAQGFKRHSSSKGEDEGDDAMAMGWKAQQPLSVDSDTPLANYTTMLWILDTLDENWRDNDPLQNRDWLQQQSTAYGSDMLMALDRIVPVVDELVALLRGSVLGREMEVLINNPNWRTSPKVLWDRRSSIKRNQREEAWWASGNALAAEQLDHHIMLLSAQSIHLHKLRDELHTLVPKIDHTHRRFGHVMRNVQELRDSGLLVLTDHDHHSQNQNHHHHHHPFDNQDETHGDGDHDRVLWMLPLPEEAVGALACSAARLQAAFDRVGKAQYLWDAAAAWRRKEKRD